MCVRQRALVEKRTRRGGCGVEHVAKERGRRELACGVEAGAGVSGSCRMWDVGGRNWRKRLSRTREGLWRQSRMWDVGCGGGGVAQPDGVPVGLDFPSGRPA